MSWGLGGFVFESSDGTEEDPDQNVDLLQCRPDCLSITRKASLLQKLERTAGDSKFGKTGTKLVTELLG